MLKADKKLTLKDFEIISKLGSGSFGVVYKVKYKENGKTYVLKQVDTSKMSYQEKKDAQKETVIHKTLSNPYIVRYMAHFMESKKINIILEYCDGGDLGKYLKLQMGKNLKEPKIWNFFIQAWIGMQYLHTRKILHRDIKTINLFMMKNESIKIGDLGVAKSLKGMNFAHTLVGTPYYLSPELCEEKAYDHKSDIWSLGCVLYELCTLKHPFTGANQAGLILRIVRGKYEPIPSFYSKELSDVISKWLKRDTRKRLSIHELLELDSVKKKAKILGISIPSREDVKADIEAQKTQMITTFQRKKTEKEEPKIKEEKVVSRSKAKPVEEKKKAKSSHLQNYKNDAPRRSPKPPLRSDHKKKMEELDNKIKEKKEKHEKLMKKRNNSNVGKKEKILPSYMKDKEPKSSLIGGEKKKVNLSAMAGDTPKRINNQKVIRPGVKHAESEIVIQKPNKKIPLSSNGHRNYSDSDKGTPSSYNKKSNEGLSRAAINAKKKGSEILKKAQQKKKESANKKDIEDVYNLPDFPHDNGNSSDEERGSGMNKEAKDLVAEFRSKSSNSKSALIGK